MFDACLAGRAAGASPGADWFLAELGAQLIGDDLPLAGGSLTLAVPHPIIARRTWLWRAENGVVIEAVGFASAGFASAGQQDSFGDAGCRWLAELAGGAVHEDVVGAGSDGPVLGWIGPRPFTEAEAGRLREVARFAAAPLAALSARATLTAALEAYLGRRTAARVLAGPLRRDVGETIRAALLYADLRSFTALSEAAPPASAPRYSCRPRNGQRADAILGRLEPPAEGIRPAASGLTAVGSRVVRNQSRAGSNPSADEIRHDAAKVSGGVTPFRGSGRPGFTRPISRRTDSRRTD